MRKLILTAISVVVLASVVVPTAFAATKVFDVKNDVSGSVPNRNGLCGGDSSGSINLDGWSKVTMWDNGHSLFTNSLTITVTDGSGGVIGEGRGGGPRVTGEGGLPFVRQFNRVIHCSDGSQENAHLGFTIDENGDTHFH